MSLEERILSYFEVAESHIKVIKKSLKYLKPLYPLDGSFREDIEDDLLQFALEALLFRFAKLQDHLGRKVFKSYLEYEGYEAKEMSLVEVLKILDDEKIVNIDLWRTFREIRNELSHEYPDDSKIAENINYIIESAEELINVYERLKKKFFEIKGENEA